MIASSSRQKKKAIFFIIFFIAFIAFTLDILDLREELHLLACPYSSLDNNVTTGITTGVVFEMEPVLVLYSADQTSSVKVSFLHLLPYGFRAPPV
jgi:hypothetical protein